MLVHVCRLDVGGRTLAEGLSGHGFVLKKSSARPQRERAELSWWRSSQELPQWQLLHRSAGRRRRRRRWWGLQRQCGHFCHEFCFLLVTLEARGMRRCWSTCGRDILTGTSGKPGKKAMVSGNKRNVDEQSWCLFWCFFFPPSFHDAVCKCLKSKGMVCSQLTGAWAPQRSPVPWRRLWAAGTISPSQPRIRAEATLARRTLLGSAACCSETADTFAQHFWWTPEAFWV